MREIIISSEVLLLLPFLPLSVPRPPPLFFVVLAQQDRVGLVRLAAAVVFFFFLQTERRTAPTTSSGPSLGKTLPLSWSHLAKSGTDKMRLACLNAIVSRLYHVITVHLQVLSAGWFIRWMGDIAPNGLGDVPSARAGTAMSSSFPLHFPT